MPVTPLTRLLVRPLVRSVILVALGLWALGAASLCVAEPQAPSGTTEPVVLRVWVTEIDEDRIRAIRYLTSLYATLRDGVEVELQSVDENRFVGLFEKSLRNGTAPALVGTAAELVVALGERGYLDVRETEAAIDRIGRRRFFAGALDMLESSAGGQHYGIPFHGWIQGIWYRDDWFKREGLAAPTTWEAIIKAARVFTQPDKGTYGILLGTMKDFYAAQIFTQLALSNNARMFDANGNVVFYSPRMVEALELYRTLARYSPPGIHTWRARDYYLQGKVAMMFYSTFIMDDLALPSVAADSLSNRNFPDLPGTDFDPQLVRNTRMVSIVHHRGNAAYGMVSALGLVRPELAPHGKALDAVCTDFLEYLYSPDVYISWLHMAPGGMMPVFRDVTGEDAFMRDLTGVFRRYGRPKVREICQGLERITNFSHTQGVSHPLASEVYARNVLSEMVVKALSGALSSEQAVLYAQERIRQIVEERRGRTMP